MSTFIPPTPAATKSAEKHEEPSEQDSFNHLLYQVLRFTSEQVQDLNDWMIHQGIPNVHEIIVQGFRRPQILEDDLHFIRENKTCYIKTHVMTSLSLMIAYIKHLRRSDKATHFGPFYYIQIDPQDYDEWRIETPEYTSRHPPSLDLLPHQDPWQPHRHLNPTSPLPTSKRGSKGMQVPTPSSRMKGTTTLSFAISRQLPRHKG